MKTLLAQRLRAARAAITPPITQRDVAKRMNVSPSAVNLWEAGKTEPSASDLAELSRWFQVSTDWLLGVESNKPLSVIKTDGPPLYTVPVVPASTLLRWTWDTVLEVLQTAVAYPASTAAAILVTSDALSSICPPGGYAVISKGHTVEPGQVVLAQIGRSSDPVLRRFVREAGDGLLVADDPRFPSFRIDDGVKIIGQVTEVTVRRQLI